MKTGIALFCLIGLGLIFDAPIWPKYYIPESDYSYVILTKQDSVSALNGYRKNIHFENRGYIRNWFWFSEMKLYIKTHVFFIFGYVVVIFQGLLWFSDVVKYNLPSKPYLTMYLFFTIGTLIDYMLSYNEAYYLYLSFNSIMVVLYGFFLIYKAWKDK